MLSKVELGVLETNEKARRCYTKVSTAPSCLFVGLQYAQAGFKVSASAPSHFPPCSCRDNECQHAKINWLRMQKMHLLTDPCHSFTRTLQYAKTQAFCFISASSVISDIAVGMIISVNMILILTLFITASIHPLQLRRRQRQHKPQLLSPKPTPQALTLDPNP